MQWLRYYDAGSFVPLGLLFGRLQTIGVDLNKLSNQLVRHTRHIKTDPC